MSKLLKKKKDTDLGVHRTRLCCVFVWTRSLLQLPAPERPGHTCISSFESLSPLRASVKSHRRGLTAEGDPRDPLPRDGAREEDCSAFSHIIAQQTRCNTYYRRYKIARTKLSSGLASFLSGVNDSEKPLVNPPTKADLA